MNTELQKYINSRSNIFRFSTLGNAKSFLKNAKYGNVTPILMGDDGYFWVCSTPKRAYQLIAAGYEEA